MLAKLLALIMALAEWNLTLNQHDKDAVADLLADPELNEYLRRARQKGVLPLPRDPCVYDFLKIHPSDDDVGG